MSYKVGIYGPLTSEALAVYTQLEIDAVFTDVEAEGEAEKLIKQAKSFGLKVYACTWTFKAPTDEDRFGVENVYGERSLWAGAGCPNNSDIRKHNLAWIEEVLGFDINGIVLDGVRFPSPGSGLSALLTCFCRDCMKKANELGYDLVKVKDYLKSFEIRNSWVLMKSAVDFFKEKLNVQELKDWMDFRCDSITDHIEDVGNTVKSTNPKVEVGTALFAPSLAPLVGQNYTDLCKILDFIQPMVYHRGDGIACVNFEIAKFVEERFRNATDHADAIKGICRILGYNNIATPKAVKELIEQGLPPAIIRREIFKAKALTRNGSATLTPIIFIVGSDRMEFKEIAENALQQNPDGLVYFAHFDSLGETV